MINKNESYCKLEVLIKQNEILSEQNKQLILMFSTFMSDHNQTTLIDDFKIQTLENASSIIGCSVPTLRTAINNKILTINIDYKFNGARKYIFSLSSLDKYKGKL